MAKKVASVGMRFDERTRFALEMLCRKRHRSSAGVVADLINRAAAEVSPPISELWAADPPSRFLNLVEKAPHLMDHTEELILAAMKLEPDLWHPIKQKNLEGYEPEGSAKRLLVGDGWAAEVDMFTLTHCWDLLHQVALGEMTHAEMMNEYANRLFMDFDERECVILSLADLTARYREKWEKLGGS